MIVARIKYNYQNKNLNILLNRVINWGDAVEVEAEVEEDTESEKIKGEIEQFITQNLGLKSLLSKEKLKEMNEEYIRRLDFSKIKIKDIISYVKGDLDRIESLHP